MFRECCLLRYGVICVKYVLDITCCRLSHKKGNICFHVVWGISLLLSKEQGLWSLVSVVYCISVVRCAQDAKALVSRGDAMLLW